MIGRHGKRRASDEETNLECLTVKKNAIQIPLLTASAANASGFYLPPHRNASGLAGLPGELFCRGVSDQG